MSWIPQSGFAESSVASLTLLQMNDSPDSSSVKCFTAFLQHRDSLEELRGALDSFGFILDSLFP
jgi:hypothetical protein